MASDVIVPRLGWSMEKGIFGEWLKKAGDLVSPGDPIFLIEADKATEEVVSEDGGILSIIPGRANPGDVLFVGTVIGYLLEPGEVLPVAASSSTEPLEKAGPSARSELLASRSPQTERTAGSISDRGRAAVPVVPGGKVAVPERPVAKPILERGDSAPFASPRARRVAGEISVDWHSLTGTGRGGRIVERDVRLAAQPPISAGPGRANPAMSSIRVTADTTDLVDLLGRMRFAEDDPVGKLGHYHGILVKLAVAAYRHKPLAGTPGNAVDLAYGLREDGRFFFRSIREANQKSVGELAREVSGRGGPGGGLFGTEAFSVIDLGALGIDEYLPGIEIPSGILLCFGRVIGGIASGASMARPPAVSLGLSFREDAVTFANAAGFLDNLRQALENPIIWLA
jgi:pyruvate dehydrogenase E2 component (dihydrolipoamide acetyltransferase)